MNKLTCVRRFGVQAWTGAEKALTNKREPINLHGCVHLDIGGHCCPIIDAIMHTNIILGSSSSANRARSTLVAIEWGQWKELQSTIYWPVLMLMLIKHYAVTLFYPKRRFFMRMPPSPQWQWVDSVVLWGRTKANNSADALAWTISAPSRRWMMSNLCEMRTDGGGGGGDHWCQTQGDKIHC